MEEKETEIGGAVRERKRGREKGRSRKRRKRKRVFIAEERAKA